MAKGFKDLPPVAQIAIMAVAAIAAVGTPTYFYVYPLYAQRAELQSKVKALNAENVTNQAFEQKRAEYLVRIADLEKQLETQRLFIPDEANTDTFMKTVFGDGAKTNIHIRTFVASAQAPNPQGNYTEMPFKVRIDGTYWSMVNFFHALAQEQRIISVTSIDLGEPKGGGMGTYTVTPDETVGANCVVTTYYASTQPAGAAKGARPK